MSGSSNQFTYQLGVTQITIGTNVVTQILPPRGTNGVYFGWQSGGSLAIMNGAGSSGNLGGFVLGTTERVNLDGPATFFLSASGATSVAGIVFKYSAGFSLLP